MQTPILLLIRYDLLLETISGIIALAISHHARTAYRLTEQKRLSDLSTGFLVLSAGMFGRVIGTLYFFVIEGSGMTPEAVTLQRVVTLAYGFMRVMAYVLFAVSTRRTTRQESEQIPGNSVVLGMALPFLLDPNLEIVAIIVLIIVVLQSIMNYGSNRNRFTILVMGGFFMLLLSHVFGILAVADISVYVLSQMFQFLGLIAFLIMLNAAGRKP